MTRFNSTTDYYCPDGVGFYEHECEECGVEFKSPREWSTICKKCWKESQGFTRDKRQSYTQSQSKPSADPFIPSEMLRRLIQLCHPDKHAGSEASLKATQWLIEQRKG